MLDSMSSTDAAEALQALADDSQIGSPDDVDSGAGKTGEAEWGWEDWLKSFNEVDAAAKVQEELKVQMQASGTL